MDIMRSRQLKLRKPASLLNLDGWNNAFSSLLVVSIVGRAAAGGDLEFPWNVPAIRKLQ
jgi:hypothetical protein